LTRVFVGPKDHDLLANVSGEISASVIRSVNLDGLINYGWLGFIARPLTAPIFWSLKHLHTLTGSYGTAIVLFTIIIYSLFFPLKWRSSKAMKKAMRHAPRMKEIQEKMKGLKQTDPRLKELQTEQLRLMKEANPLGGCLPLLIQMPFLIALYTAITISIDFRQTSFLWMPDLSAADPYRLLPILMAGSMVVSPNHLDCHRLGITASRKVSLRAVDRNRLKRLIRETFRLSEIVVSSTEKRYDWVINVKRSLLKVKLADSLKDFQRLISCLAIEEESKTYQAGQEKP
jgi:YidC/Oxa1 family membrane protein insertase